MDAGGPRENGVSKELPQDNALIVILLVLSRAKDFSGKGTCEGDTGQPLPKGQEEAPTRGFVC